jgi:hypothetical protein
MWSELGQWRFKVSPIFGGYMVRKQKASSSHKAASGSESNNEESGQAIVVIALVTSIGVAGVPSASLVAIAIILTAVGLPIEAIGVLLVFDRILDMSRTATNVFGDACCTVIVSRMQGEELPELKIGDDDN